MARAHTTRRPKERISLSLSAEAVRYLKAYRERTRMPSLSALVEAMVADFRRARAMHRLSADVNAHYDSLSEEESREDSAWGEFGEYESGA
jgi:hypothetical protein